MSNANILAIVLVVIWIAALLFLGDRTARAKEAYSGLYPGFGGSEDPLILLWRTELEILLGSFGSALLLWKMYGPLLAGLEFILALFA